MVVIFLRHGDAEAAGPGERADDVRELTRTGRKETKLVAAALNRLRFRPRILLTSPLIRAVQTAEIAAGELKRARRPVISDVLSPGHDWLPVKKVILGAATRSPDEAVLVCGHQPDLGQYIAELISEHRGSGVEVRKSSAVCLEWDNTSLKGVGRICLVLEPAGAKRILKIAGK